MKSVKDGVDLEVVSLQETTATLSSLALGPRLPDITVTGGLLAFSLESSRSWVSATAAKKARVLPVYCKSGR